MHFITLPEYYLRENRLIKESGLKIHAFDGLDEAAAKAVELGRGGPAPI